MPFYTGTKPIDDPDCDIQEFEGMYASPNGKYWANYPISLKEEKEMEYEVYKRNTRRERRKLNRYKPKE